MLYVCLTFTGYFHTSLIKMGTFAENAGKYFTYIS